MSELDAETGLKPTRSAGRPRSEASRASILDSAYSFLRRFPISGISTIHIARHNEGDCPLELHGEGIVVRIEPGKATRPSQRPRGFAASMHFYSELSNVSNDLDQDTSDPYKHLHCQPR